MHRLTPSIIEVAKGFVGISELSVNAGFSNPEFQKEMIKSGWYKGAPWCAFFAETVYRLALLQQGEERIWANLRPLFSGNALETLRNFQNKGYTLKQTPQPGDLVFWQFGNGHSGHEGIAIENPLRDSKLFVTVEGNTGRGSNDPEQIIRDGQGCMLKTRRYGTKHSDKAGAFNLKGFISPLS
jgi:hypothetical protein